MIKEILKYADYGMFAEIALVMFAGIFLVVAWRTFRQDSRDIAQQASVVLNDLKEISHRE